LKKILIPIITGAVFLSLMHLSGRINVPHSINHVDATLHAAEKLPIFDTHVHYKEPAWKAYPPDAIIRLLKKTGVVKALVSSTPDEGTRMLYRADPDRIIPFLRPYHGAVGSSNWYVSDTILSYLTQRLEMPIYKGIGEFHIHDPLDADSPVIQKTVAMAVERKLFIHVHSNHEAVSSIFSYEPRIKVLWAHAGMSDPPDVVSGLLDRFENLWVDISIREYDIAPGGKLDPEWKKLFLRHPDRITIGSDTWVNGQWDNYEAIIDFDRTWLAQLPPDVARQIAFANANRLFGS